MSMFGKILSVIATDAMVLNSISVIVNSTLKRFKLLQRGVVKNE